jgi:hemerythrin-like metal-binding protein
MGSLHLTPVAQTGHQDIDAQVQTLLSIASDVLFSKGRIERSPVLFRNSLGFFVTYLAYHFASEEVAMARTRYPGRNLHADFHAQVVREAAALESLARCGSLWEARHALLYLVEDRLFYHIQSDDQQLADFLSEAQVRQEAAKLPGIRELRTCGSLERDFDERMLQELAKLGHPERLSCSSTAGP